MSLRYPREPWEISLEYTPSWEFCSLSPAAHPQQGTLGIIKATARSLATLWAPGLWGLTWIVHLSTLLLFYQLALGHQSCGPKTRKPPSTLCGVWASLGVPWCQRPAARPWQPSLGSLLLPCCAHQWKTWHPSSQAAPGHAATVSP